MTRIFDRNMFFMFLTIMVGAVFITYFVADIVNRSTIDTLTSQHVIVIETMTEKNENFTSGFLESSILLDLARENRATGTYHFDEYYRHGHPFSDHVLYRPEWGKNNRETCP